MPRGNDGDADVAGGTHCAVQYEFVPHTPPTSVSAIATGGASMDRSLYGSSSRPSLSAFSMGTSTMIMTPPTNYSADPTHHAAAAAPTAHANHQELLPAMAISQRIPLVIQVRKWRVLFVAILLVVMLVLCVRVLQRGIVVARSSEQLNLGILASDAYVNERLKLRQRADDLNFYVGTGVSAIAKLFEIGAMFVLPIVVLVLLTENSMLNDSLYWVIGMLAVQGFFISFLTNAFSTTYVGSSGLIVVERRMLEADLFHRPSTAAHGLAEMVDAANGTSASTTLFPRRMSADTMLRTAAIRPPYVRPTLAKCTNGNNSRALAVNFGFYTNDWLRDLVADGAPIQRSINFSVRDWLATPSPQNKTHPRLPFNMTTCANLAIHAMNLLVDRLKMPLFSGSTVDPLELYASRAQVAQQNQDNALFLRATAMMLNESLAPMERFGFFVAPHRASVQFASVELNALLTFQAITVTLPFQPRLMRRSMVATQFGTLREDHNADLTKTGDAVYQVFPTSECGYRGCWLTKPNSSLEHDAVWSMQPEIVAYSRCKATFDSIGANSLHFIACMENEIANNSIVVGALGSTLHADAFVEYDSQGFATSTQRVRRANVTNVRRTMSFTVGFLTWKFTNLAAFANAQCDVRPSSSLLVPDSPCEGLWYPLGPKHIVLVGKDRIIADALSPIGSRVGSGHSLASIVTDLPKGSYLSKRNIKNVTSQVSVRPGESFAAPCARDLEFIADSIEHNHWYIDHSFQESYTAALFHLFQFGVSHDVTYMPLLPLGSGRLVPNVSLLGDVLALEFRILIPAKSAAFSLVMAMLFLVSVAVVVVTSKRRECTIREVMDVHRVARVHLVERFFPKIFLKTTVYDTEQGQSFAPFRIVSMKLRHTTPLGDVFVTLPAPVAPAHGMETENGDPQQDTESARHQGFLFRPTAAPAPAPASSPYVWPEPTQ